MVVHPGSIWIEQNWPRLIRGQWVAASSDGIVAEGPDYDRVIDAIRRRRMDLSEVTIVQVPVGIVQ